MNHPLAGASPDITHKERKTIVQVASLFNQLLQHFPRIEFAALVKKHSGERAAKALPAGRSSCRCCFANSAARIPCEICKGTGSAARECPDRAGRSVDLSRALNGQSLMRTFVIKFLQEGVELGLLLEDVRAGGARGFLLERQMHALMAAVLLGVRTGHIGNRLFLRHG